jgi:hypothetical protein
MTNPTINNPNPPQKGKGFWKKKKNPTTSKTK